MGDLFFNKLAGAIIGIGLLIMGLMELSNRLFEVHPPETLAYAVELDAVAPVVQEEEEDGPVDFGVLLANADVSSGERVARRCASCHTFEEGGGNGTGPYMWDVMGRDVAGVDGYGYSSAMVSYAEGGRVWGFQNMYDYLENPRSYVEGTAMSFAGLRNQEDRINIIAYMRTLSGDPIDLPAPLAAAVEAVEEAPAALDDAAAAIDGAVEASEEILEEAPADAEPPAEGGEGEDG